MASMIAHITEEVIALASERLNLVMAAPTEEEKEEEEEGGGLGERSSKRTKYACSETEANPAVANIMIRMFSNLNLPCRDTLPLTSSVARSE